MSVRTPPSARPAGAAVAAFPEASVVELLTQLVRVPTRAGLDPYEPALDLFEAWLTGQGLTPRRLRDDAGQPVAVACDLTGAKAGPRYVLDACLDTAPFGDEAAWRYPPTAGVVDGGWLHGRGSADSKAAVAVFAHLLVALRDHRDELHGSVTLLADVDEHTGRFGGARRYFQGPDAPGDVAGVMIGYPGPDHVVVGSRGFLRAALTVHGTAGHSGARAAADGNAVDKAVRLAGELAARPLPVPTGPGFGLPPKLTITAMHGGEGYTIVPDRCEVCVDVRLTPTFDAAAARALLAEVVADLDRHWPTTRPTDVEVGESWPAYRLGPDSRLAGALLDAAAGATGHPVAQKVSGPSNIGNYLAALGIEATAGFGVRYQGLHGTDERIELASLPAVLTAYRDALLALLGPGAAGDG